MKSLYPQGIYTALCKAFLLVTFLGFSKMAVSQNCPASTPVTITTNPNTYYPGVDSALNAGVTSITLGTASGPVPIATGDLLLLIQMQGAQINSSNSSSYGSNTTTANGYLSNSAMLAGNMEYVVASGGVSLSGGTLALQMPTVKSYRNAAFGTDGQYRYQVIRVALYYNLTFGANITATAWNGNTGGVLVISVTNLLNFNGKTLSAAGAGFRGGGARQLNGGSGGLNSDVVTLSSKNYNGSKGEGIAGTPRFINNNGSLLDNGASNEGYPNGSYAAGGPGNAGGGGTDGRPASNDENSGGGGGSNGGIGGSGGNSWNSNLPTGGKPGGMFQEKSPSNLVMGGGGGAGTTNNGTGLFTLGFSSSGAAGGGIVLVTADAITGTGTINVSGSSGNLTVLNDGSGGGGAGGSVLLYAGSGQSNITITADGGTGGTNTGTGSPHGPGGGGGGGVIYSNASVNTASSAAAGTAGYTAGTNHYNASAGTIGIIIQNVARTQAPSQFLYCNLLPVRFESMAAAWLQKNIQVKWQVSNEDAVKNYIVERSTNGNSFEAIAVISYNAGTSNNLYNYIDTKIPANISTLYYRIREVSNNDKAIYSSVVSISITPAADASLSVSPNPATGSSFTIRFAGRQVNNTVILRLVSASGQAVWQKQTIAAAGVNTISITNAASFPAGIYFLQYYNGTETQTTRIIFSH